MFALPYGEEGIFRCGEILREEIERGMRLLGVNRIKELGEQYVNARKLESLVFDNAKL